MQTKILTLQSKGQIMIPKVWRDEMESDVYQAVKKGEVIILTPVRLSSDKEVISAAKKVMKNNKPLLKKLAA